MTAGSIWAEMYKIKGYLFQIEMYTDRKRHNIDYCRFADVFYRRCCIIYHSSRLDNNTTISLYR